MKKGVCNGQTSKKNPVIFIRSRKTAGVEKNEFYSRFYQVID